MFSFSGTVVLSKSLAMSMYYFYNKPKCLLEMLKRCQYECYPVRTVSLMSLCPSWSLRLVSAASAPVLNPVGGHVPLCSLYTSASPLDCELREGRDQVYVSCVPSA